MTTMAQPTASKTATQVLFDSLPATLADLDQPGWDQVQDYPALEDFLTSRQVERLVTEDHCFICRRSTDHRGEDHVATQDLVARFAAAVSV